LTKSFNFYYYIATDLSGNRADCTFNAYVIRKCARWFFEYELFISNSVLYFLNAMLRKNVYLIRYFYGGYQGSFSRLRVKLTFLTFLWAALLQLSKLC